MRTKINWNDGWSFTPSYDEALTRPDCTLPLETVRIPHTVKETPFHYFSEKEYQMVSGYRRTFLAPAEWQQKTVRLTFGGVAHDAAVYLNGREIAVHHCGYTAFSVVLNPYLNWEGENVLALRVDSRENLNVPPFGHVIDYMTYGGIYREVWLDLLPNIYLENAFLHTRIDSIEGDTGTGILSGEYTLCGAVRPETTLRMVQTLIAPDGTEQSLGEQSVSVTGAGETLRMECPLDNVMLWGVEHPVCYRIRTELMEGDRLLDADTVTTGFRKAVFRADGFYLNGKKLKLRGMNRHQSYAYVGYAMPKSMQELDADILKNELGLNAVRTSHYPQSHHFLNRCDEIGLLVFTEIPGWQHIGDEEWKLQAIANTEEMVMQYRNHPSIFLWGVRINESPDDDSFYVRTNAAAHKLDPTRSTGGVRCHKKSSLLEDVYTYNDFVHNGTSRGCEPKKKVTSNKKKAYLISEYNGHMFPTKSYDSEEHRCEHALRHARVLNAVGGQEDIAGSFGWCMADYNTHKDFGSGDRICYHGVLDMFRNPKPAAAVYASQQEKTPVLELSSTMDIGEHPECNRQATYLFTNADSVRMYKNDRFIKEYFPSDSSFRNLKHGPILIDDYIGDMMREEQKMSKGESESLKKVLNAVARYGIGHLPKRYYLTALKLKACYGMTVRQAMELYNLYVGNWGQSATVYRFDAVKDGEVVASLHKEPMEQMHLTAIPDHTALKEEATYDVALVRIRAEDEHGNLLPFANEPLSLQAEGEISLIGPELIPLQGGMTGVYVKTTGQPGTGRLIIQSPGLETVTVTFSVEREEEKA